MSIKVIRNTKESSDRLVQRFNKKVQSARILLLVKGKRFHKQEPRKRQVRAAAIIREAHRNTREKAKFQ